MDNILKSRHYFANTCLVKAIVFSEIIYGCESWTIKKAECQRIYAFKLWRWRRLLRVPWTPRRSNQSILKEISPGCSLEGLMLKLKLQYFGHLMWRTDSLEKTLILGKTEGRRRRGWQRMRRLDGITDSMDMLQSTGRKESDMSYRLNWTDSDRVCWGRHYLAIERSLNVLSGLLTSLQVFSLPLFLPCCAAPCFQLL